MSVLEEEQFTAFVESTVKKWDVIYARKYSIAGIYAVITTCWSIVDRADLQ
jgi:hypothetical protein